MSLDSRNKRVRQLVKKLNQERKKQAKKIDILCNDFVNAQKDFVKSLNVMQFAANFYESIIGLNDPKELLTKAGSIIREEIEKANFVFFLRQDDGFVVETIEPAAINKEDLENCFTDELIEDICRANKLCSLNMLLEMGLQVNPKIFDKLSAVTIPLSNNGRSTGFLFIYSCSPHILTVDELNYIHAIMPGLSKALQSCQIFN